MTPFIGRERELQDLQDLFHQRQSVIAVIKGRRRIGKSRLIEEFAQGKQFFSFAGRPPTDETSVQDQRDEFARQCAEIFNKPLQTFNDWGDAFCYLSKCLPANEKKVVLLDEISWMGSKDHLFIPALKVCWDLYLQKVPNLVLIFCGSVSTWIQKNIIMSTGFFGRITLEIELEQLSLPECKKLIQSTGFKGSPYDTLKLLSITGGVPWYLEKVFAGHMTDSIIKKLCFEKEGLLTIEFDKIFHDLFNGHGSVYKKIIHLLADGMKSLTDIRDALNYPRSGVLSALMKDLVASGFVSYHYSWSFKTEQIGMRGLYRLSDNYLRFFIKYIEPNLAKINTGSYKDVALSSLLGWDTIMGLQVENLLLNNRSLLLKSLDINWHDIVAENPYLQRATTRHKGCQIDYLVQTHTKSLFICEFKFKRHEIKLAIIDEMKDKITRFAPPRGFGVVPVLFHLGGVSEEVYEKRYFYRIVDISDFLDKEN